MLVKGIINIGSVLTLGLLSGLAPVALAESLGSSAYYYVPTVPEDMNSIEMYLLTGGVGHEVNDRFGHTAIRVVNRVEGTDVVFNWGKFSFDDPGFLWKFFRGQLNYSLGVRSFRNDVAVYKRMERRMIMDHLNLTGAQKRQLLSKIAWNAIPEHRTFSYQYWYKNCATIPRDYLNDVLGGQIKRTFGAEEAHRVFRDYVRRNLAYLPFIVPLLDVLMNGNIDRPISAWDDMFLPANLRQWLLKLPAFDDQARPIPSSKLLSDEEIVLDHAEDYTPAFNDYLLSSAPIILGVVLALFGILLGSTTGLTWAYRALGFATVWWGLLGGILGVTLLLNWGFSGHPDGWHNMNLLLFWPTDWLFVAIGLDLLRQRHNRKNLGSMRRFARWSCFLHVAAALLLLLLSLTGVSGQNTWQILAWYGLPASFLMVLLYWRGFQIDLAKSPGRKPNLGDAVPVSIRVQAEN